VQRPLQPCDIYDAFGVPQPSAVEEEEEEEALRTARRARLSNLLGRAARGALASPNEGATLCQLTETEMREADAARAESARWLAFIERGMDTHMQFSVVQPDGTTQQLPCADWCHACRVEKAEAAIERVRAQADAQRARGVSRSTDYKGGLYDAAVAILAALDNTAQPATRRSVMPEQPSDIIYFIRSRPAPGQPWQPATGANASWRDKPQALERLAARRQMQPGWEHELMERVITVTERPVTDE
jgi:hypothetical protein